MPTLAVAGYLRLLPFIGRKLRERNGVEDCYACRGERVLYFFCAKKYGKGGLFFRHIGFK